MQTTCRGPRWLARGGIIAVPLVVIVLTAVAVHGSASSVASGVPPVASDPTVAKGRWRLAPRTELDRTVLFVSQILIRHRDAEPRVAPFNVGHWRRLSPPPSRSRDEASALARELAERARAAPSSFAELAKTQSEDEVSAPAGGSLGGVRATIFASWPQVLDALATLQEGAISGVVETQFGFHVFKRNPVPAEDELAARRLVLGYEGADWLDVVRRKDRQAARRTRSEALARAQELLTKARSAPQQFGKIIEEYSEHSDVAQGGDIGVWSTLEAGDLEREREVLARLKVGEISDPIDTAVGITLLQRTGELERPRYAMAAIELAFDSEAQGESETSRSAVREKAALLAKLLAERPEEFQNVQQQLCCADAVHWTAGRGPAGVAQSLPLQTIGSISPSPVESFSAFLIVKRLDPALLPSPPQPRFTLPSPDEPDLAYFIRNGTSQHFRALIEAAGAEYARAITAAAARDVITRVQAELLQAVEKVDDGAERLALFRAAMRRLGEGAGADEQHRYERLVTLRLEALLLGGR